MNAIFNVELYEQTYGPIETVDVEADERKRLVRRYRRREKAIKYRKKLFSQRKLGVQTLLGAAICAHLANIVPELYFVAFVFVILGAPLLVTDKIFIA